LDKISVRVDGQENDLCSATGLAQLLAGIYPADNGHRNVRDDYVGLKVLRGVEKRLAVRHTPDNLAGRCQQAFHDHPELTMVIR
jgi:hypothetical protein